MERLGGETIYNKYSKYLPYNKTEVVGGKENNDLANYLIMTNYTEGDWTIPNVDKFYDIIMWSNPAEYYLSLIHISPATQFTPVYRNSEAALYLQLYCVIICGELQGDDCRLCEHGCLPARC